MGGPSVVCQAACSCHSMSSDMWKVVTGGSSSDTESDAEIITAPTLDFIQELPVSGPPVSQGAAVINLTSRSMSNIHVSERARFLEAENG